MAELTQYIARISYGKDSLKMLEVIKSRGLPLDRITTTDVWATDTIPANLPPMMAFKDRMDQRIWDMYRIDVEHLCALNKDGSKRTYEQMFYHIPVRRSQIGNVERERERERERESRVHTKQLPDSGEHHRIPSQHRVQLVPETQAIQPGGRSRDGHSATRQYDGVNISRAEQRPNGFPVQISPWCRKLKIDKVKTPSLRSAPRGAETEISWNIWASLRMSLLGLAS